VSQPVRLIALEDLVARSAKLALDLAGGVPTPSKYVRGRLAELVEPNDGELAWQDQRKPNQPRTFCEANSLLQTLIPARQDLLIIPNTRKIPTRFAHAMRQVHHSGSPTPV
jgi:hypothetical protein